MGSLGGNENPVTNPGYWGEDIVFFPLSDIEAIGRGRVRDGEGEGSGTNSRVIAFRVAMSIFTNVGEGTCQCVVVKILSINSGYTMEMLLL